MGRKFTKYPSNYVKASESPYGYGRPLFDKEYEYEQLYGKFASFSFDFVAPNGYSDADVESIVKDAFQDEGCKVIAVDFRSVDYPDWQASYAAAPAQVGCDFNYRDDYDELAIIDTLRDYMAQSGYEVIGNPEFY